MDRRLGRRRHSDITTGTQERETKQRSTKLLREVGLIGLMWASMGSIIGSGWLFGPQEALIAAGPAAIISWVIGGIAIVVLALVHAELGGMYPVSGGTARFPHYAFGGVAGASFGWFAWLNAATVAPIEVSAMLTYAGHYDFAKGWIDPETAVLSTTGIVVAIILMALLTAINFLGVKRLATTNSAATWWKIAIPLLTILVLAIANFNPGNLTAANGFSPEGLKGIFAAVSTGGIIFSYLGFEQADQLAGESANPKRDVPFAIIGSVIFGTILYILLQIVFLFALPASAIGDTWDQVGPGSTRPSPARSPRSRPCSRSAGWPRSSTPTPSSAPEAPASSTRPAPRAWPTAWPATATCPPSSSGPTSAACRGPG